MKILPSTVLSFAILFSSNWVESSVAPLDTDLTDSIRTGSAHSNTLDATKGFSQLAQSNRWNRDNQQNQKRGYSNAYPGPAPDSHQKWNSSKQFRGPADLSRKRPQNRNNNQNNRDWNNNQRRNSDNQRNQNRGYSNGEPGRDYNQKWNSSQQFRGPADLSRNRPRNRPNSNQGRYRDPPPRYNQPYNGESNSFQGSQPYDDPYNSPQGSGDPMVDSLMDLLGDYNKRHRPR